MDHSKWIIRGPFQLGFSSLSWHDHCKGRLVREEIKFDSGRPDISRAGGYLRATMFWGSLVSITAQRQLASKAASGSASALRIEWFRHAYNRGEEAPSELEGPLCKGIQFL
jgi:hypothetical protein